MRTLISTLAIYSMFLSSTFAGIPEEVKKLGDLAFGSSLEFTAKGKTKDADDLFKKFITADHGDFEQEYFKNKEIGEMDYGDEIYYGFTSTKSALEMSGFAQGQLEDLIENAEPEEAKELKIQYYDLQKNWARSVKSLANQGAKFGYDGHGPGYCGISFVRMFVIDPATGKVYSINLSQGGSC